MKLGADDPYVRRGYGQERIEPGERPAVLVVALQHWDVHRRYAEVTTSDEVLAYLADLAVPA